MYSCLYITCLDIRATKPALCNINYALFFTKLTASQLGLGGFFFTNSGEKESAQHEAGRLT